jgi:preprotein translocase subunit YajC
MTKMALPLDPLSFLAQAAAPQGSGWSTMIFMGLMFAAMYFLMIAPQLKKQKQHEKMLAALTSGDEIVTTGGIYGTITKVGDSSLQLQIANNVRIEVSRAAVVGYQGQEPVGDALSQSKS